MIFFLVKKMIQSPTFPPEEHSIHAAENTLASELTNACFHCRGAEVDVKRLPKRPAPPRFGRKLTEAQKVYLLSRANDSSTVQFLSSSTEDRRSYILCKTWRAG